MENPIDRLESVCATVEDWLFKSQELSEAKVMYLRSLENFNRIIDKNDLP